MHRQNIGQKQQATIAADSMRNLSPRNRRDNVENTQRNSWTSDNQRASARFGFTITELLVSMALIMFMMAILSEAFIAGLDTFRNLKAIGDMDQNLRSAIVSLQRDLQALHFDRRRPQRLSELTHAPDTGFFSIRQLSPSVQEGGATVTDSDPVGGIPSFVAAGEWNPRNAAQPNVPVPSGHILHFSIDLARTFTNEPNYKALRVENFLSATVVTPPASTFSNIRPYGGPNLYLSQAAEVAYFLRATTARTAPTAAGAAPQTLYTLYRRQLVIADPSHIAIAPPPPPAFPPTTFATNQYGNRDYDFSAIPNPTNPAQLQFSTMFDPPQPAPPAAAIPKTGVSNPANRSLSYSSANPPWRPFPIFGNNLAGGVATNLGDRGENTNPNNAGLVANTLRGSDILLTNVVSFCVRVMPNFQTTPPITDFMDVLAWAPVAAATTPTLGSGVFNGNFDTNNIVFPPPTSPPAGVPVVNYTLRAVQISIRVWDDKTKQTRQITLVQDL